ncbi:MAG: DmsC/YnfH family molybdoenzyme membrane anchor subunit [Gammaproteobacteria bacterium]|nr:DmsC/YnfH family molybdoenzyme membrane anchor subunit [Gammaproteobacteria bacterium]
MSADGKPWLQAHWDGHVAVNFLTGGSGSGLLVIAGLAALAGQPLALASWIGLLLVAGGLAQVSLHLGRPVRGWRALTNLRTSWMTREAYAAAALMPCALLAALTDSPLAGMPAALAAAAFLYCQARILKESRGIPAWREPRIVPLIVLTGLAEGAAIYLLILLPGAHTFAVLVVGAVLLAVLAARYVAWKQYRTALHGRAPRASEEVLERAEGPFTGAGHVAPVLLLLVAAGVPQAQGILATLAAATVLLAGWGVKFAIVTRAGYNQGFAIDHTPSRGSGTGGVGSKPGW